MDKTQIRLNKFLAERLGLSRREADEIISAGRVKVDNRTATLGAKIDNNSKVCYNNKIVPFKTEYTYIALHKPIGYVCSRHAQGKAPTIYDLLPKQYHSLKTVGRLDKDSSGLILLTNDGDFAYQMTHPKFRKSKVYEVELSKPLQPLHQQMISDFGVMLSDGPSKFTIIPSTGDEPQTNHQASSRSSTSTSNNQSPMPADRTRFTVVLTEGRNRQIRRTFAALGYQVTRLHRTKFGKFELNLLASGKCDIIKI